MKLQTQQLDIINTKIMRIWEKYSKILTEDKLKFLQKIPLQYIELEKECLLFIGSNPSYSSKGKIRYLSMNQEFQQYLSVIDDIFDFQNYEKYREIYSKMNEYLFHKHQDEGGPDYFNRMKEISAELKLAWEHIDLFYVCHTTQKDIENLFYKKEAFLSEQLVITKEIINLLNPKLIIVGNAFASWIIKKEYNLNKFDETHGTYFAQINDKKVPVFFSGMLSGQRALDFGSFERLKWQVRTLWNSLNKISV